MAYLFPIHIVYIGNVLIGILFLIALQQLCWSSVNGPETPSVKSKLLTTCFCLATYILNWLLIYHYSFHDDNEAVTIIRLFTCATFCLGAVTFFKFVVSSFDALYKSKKNQHKSPTWFVFVWKLSMTIFVLSLIIGSFCAYYFKNGIFFSLYYIIIDITVLIGCIACVISLFEIRKRINQIIQNTDKLSLTLNHENSITSSNTMYYYKKQAKKLKKKKIKLNIIVIIIILGIWTVAYNLYDAIKHLDFETKISIFNSPYPNLTDYIIHILFTLACDSVLVLWIYKPSRCCKRRKNKQEPSKTILETPNNKRKTSDANDDNHNMDNHKTKISATSSTTTVDENMIILYLCCPCLNCNDDGAFGTYAFEQTLIDQAKKDNVTERMRNKVKQRRNLQNLTYNDDTVTAMPKSSTTIELDDNMNDDIINLVIYNFENVLLSAPNLIYTINTNGLFDELCGAFGGVNRVRILAKHFNLISQKGIKLIIFSEMISQRDIQCILSTLNLSKRCDGIIGSDHVWFKHNRHSSLNEKLLKITEQFASSNNIGPNNILYIDSEKNTYNIDRFNICDTMGISQLDALSNDDIIKIENTLNV